MFLMFRNLKKIKEYYAGGKIVSEIAKQWKEAYKKGLL